MIIENLANIMAWSLFGLAICAVLLLTFAIYLLTR